MPLGGSEKPQDALLKELVARQTAIDKRVERLESLEFHHARDGLGCITFVDSDIGVDAIKRVDTTPAACGANYCYSTMTIFWCLKCTESPPTALHMQVDGLVGANYDWTLSYVQGAGATTQQAGAGQTSWTVGYMGQNTYATGSIHIPFFTLSDYPRAFGEWVMYDGTEEAGLKVQRGNWGGYCTYDLRRPFRYDFFGTAGNIVGNVFLYGWCPEMTPGGAPVD